MLKRTIAMACAAATTCGLAYGQAGAPGGLATPPEGADVPTQPAVERAREQVQEERVRAQRNQPARERTERAEEGTLRRAARGNLARASDLMGTTVKSSDGTMVGTIKDFVIDTRANEVAYVILEGERASTDGYLVMPWAVARYAPVTAENQTRSVTINVAPQRLQGAPVIAAAALAATTNDFAWAPKVDTYYQADLPRRANRLGRDGRPVDRNRLDGEPRDRDGRFDRENPRPDRLDDAADDARERIQDRARDQREAVEDRADRIRERADEVREDTVDRLDRERERAAGTTEQPRAVPSLKQLENEDERPRS